MSFVINILFIVNALILIGVVLIQQPKTSGGLFSGTGQSLLGTSGKPFWTKATIIVASVFMLLCLLMVKFPAHETGQSSVADMIEKQSQQPVVPSNAGSNPAGAASSVPANASAPSAKPAVSGAPAAAKAPEPASKK